MGRTKNVVKQIRTKAPRKEPSGSAGRKGKVSRSECEDYTPEPRWYRPGTTARRDIRAFLKTEERVTGNLSYQRLVRELAQTKINGTRFTSTALDALQEACTAFLMGHFENFSLCVRHAKRVTPCPGKSVSCAVSVSKRRAGCTKSTGMPFWAETCVQVECLSGGGAARALPLRWEIMGMV